MKEFLYNNYLNIVFSFEILAAVTGILLYRKYKNTVAKIFIIYLVYIVFVDVMGSYTYHVYNNGFLSFLKGTRIETNHWWGTLTWKIGGVLFFGFYYSKIIETKLFKKIIKSLNILFLVSSLICIMINFQVFFRKFFIFIDIIGALLIFSCVFMYFLEILQSDKILKFHKSLNFYISLAVLFWWLIITPLIFFNEYFNTEDWNFVLLQWEIYLFAIAFMYSTFAVGLVISKPEKDILIS